MRKQRLIVLTAVAGLVASGSAIAWAATSQPAQPQHSAQSRTVAAAPIDTTTESKFTPVQPCRAADTRVAGGRLGSNQLRDFYVGGALQFTGQGGPSGGCGVPTTATAVTVTITAISASHNGYLKVWKTTGTEPSTSFMDYGTAVNGSGSNAVQISPLGRIRIRNVGSTTHLAVDVTGYYVAPLMALVGSGGTLVSGSRVTSAFLISGTTSSYEVDFDRDVSHCTYAASSYFGGYTLTVEPRTGQPNGVYVFTEFGSTATTDQFYLTVTC